jgi:hypothetical protein
LGAWRRRGSPSYDACDAGWCPLQDSPESHDGREDTVGDAAGLHGREEFIDDFVRSDA